MHFLINSNVRNNRGQAVAVSTFVIAIMLIAAAGLFGFELTRSTLAREQLKIACQAAAMAGAASMAGSDEADTKTMQMNAQSNAMQIFKRNFCLGMSLQNAQQGAGPSTPKAYDCYVNMQYVDPDTNNPVSLGDPKGKVLRIAATYGLKPAFDQFLHLPTLPLVVTASAGVPAMDVVMCFDVSGSIDDQTPVTFVKRVWDGKKTINYEITSSHGSPVGPLAQGKLYDVLGPQPTGTGTNATPPEDLVAAGLPDNRWPLYFSEYSGFGANAAPGLRGKANKGKKPGNAPVDPLDDGSGVGASTGSNYTFTDLVVNIDGKDVFGGISVDGYDFPDVGTLVEAARGNLEDKNVFKKSGAANGLKVSPQSGYQAKYFEYAKKNIHPLTDAQQAAITFFTILNNDTNAHFGLVSFSSQAGTTGPGPSAPMIDEFYPQGGTGTFPIPLVSLNPAIGATNYDQMISTIPTTTAYGGTNIGDSIHTAVAMLKSSARKGARKAIVLFTDGQPTAGGPLSGDPWSNARLAAQEAHDAGIPIYTIGLAQNKEIVPGEVSILNDSNKDPASGGVAGIAGGDGKFFLVTNQKYLRVTFENLARQFVQILRG